MLKTAIVEVNATLGTFVKVQIMCDNEGFPEVDCLQEAVKQAIKDKYKIDDDDSILNNLIINNWKLE